MAFTQFKTVGMVLQKYQLQVGEANFLALSSVTPAPELLQRSIAQKLQRRLFRVSEAAICEQLIYPLLETAWIATIEEWLLWSHTSLDIDEHLTGVPDYLLTPPTQYGSEVLGAPILVTVEAKKDNFDEGWGQCAAAMVAAQKTNSNDALCIYGIVSNGETWQFAFLQHTTFTRNTIAFDIYDLDTLYAALVHIFTHCKEQLVAA
jgi:hypothetical protein